jgi:hypothetical protein
MKRQLRRTWLAALGLVLMALLAAHQSASGAATFGASMSGIDHLPDYLSVSNFSVNGSGGFQAGKGARSTPSPPLPDKWHPGLTVHVKWVISDWKHRGASHHQADVPVDRYTEPGTVYVHFLADGTVRVGGHELLPVEPQVPRPARPYTAEASLEGLSTPWC